MTYLQAREYIASLTPRGIVPGLYTMSRLLALLGDPQDAVSTIHIAGTNGKGSTGVFIESSLICGGKSVCRFSSPAVGDYLEMFTYNGRPVSGSLYAQAAADIKTAAAELEADGVFPTSFEAETTAAFLMFSRLKPDFAIIECGMGGALDATNVIKAPAVSVITSVSSDHTAFLGGTLTEIARHKAGIIKPSCVVVSSPQPTEAAEVIKQTAADKNAELCFVGDIKNAVYHSDGTEFDYKNEHYKIKMLGAYQPQNAALAIEAARRLGISQTAIKDGLASARLPFRFECIGKFILDGAHNEGAARMLVRSLKLYAEPEKTAFICGCFRDKDYKKIADITAPYTAAVYCIKPPTERGLISAELCRAFKTAGAMAYDSGNMAAAIGAASHGGYEDIVIFGSLSILKEARDIIGGQREK
ncbi:MAG: bifunctional folylpolyglutamate synthase/dihydrofolate synthase [Clostridia bacterium]|nr:bifunctional folylpolyglutamate synthase/dihydrofolate synthase [Clostridia bacterium]